MKSIILVAGRGTRMGAITLGIGGYHRGTSKPLLPVFDKPSVYYALSDSIAAGIKDILIIAAPDNVDEYKRLLGDGSYLGINIEYAVQDDPKGIAEAFIIGEQFIGDDDVALMFGDNLFNGKRFTEALRQSATNLRGASIFALRVPNPSDYGVVEFDSKKRAVSLEEKPEKPKSDYAVPGTYFYTSDVVEIAKALQPSARGELEITDVNMAFLARNLLDVQVLDDDTDWFDTGNPFALDDAADYVRDFQERHPSILIGSPEATAFKMGFINRSQLLDMATKTKLKGTDYGIRLRALAEAA
jgi:glucose-1-phosphate thymidylyltransferase